MTLDFEELKNSVKEDEQQFIKDNEDTYCVTVVDETNDTITVWDNTGFIDRTYTITNPNVISKDWLQKRIIKTKSLEKLPYRVNFEKLVEWLLSSMDKFIYMNLSKMIFVNDTEEDWDELCEVDDDFQYILEVNELPDDKCLGIMWFEQSMVVVNVGSIIRCVQNAVIQDGQEGDDEHWIYPWEAQKDINEQIIVTLTHELRHLAQANPYLTEELLCQESDDEEDAEDFARFTYENNPVFLIEKTK